MAKGELYMGPDVAGLVLLTAFGREFGIRELEISREERTASGKLVKDIVAVKKVFTLDYGLIDGPDLQIFVDFYELHSELLFRYYTDETTFEDYTVLPDPVDRRRFLHFGGDLWARVNIVLQEV